LKKAEKEVFKIVSELLAPQELHVAIIPHVNPDGDAIGSAVGLANLLVNKGNQVVIVSPNSYPLYYNWLESKAEIIFADKEPGKAKKSIKNSHILFCLDFNDIERVGKLSESIGNFSGNKIMVDHHPDPKDFCNLVISDPLYSSTAELIFDTIEKLGLAEYIDKSVAESLFTGIMTDTGSFSHNISRANAFNVAGRLIGYGIDVEQIHAAVYHNFSADRLRLLGYCLEKKMEVIPEYKSAIITISKRELKKFNFVPGDIEGFVNYPLSITGIVFSALFIEKKDHIKVSFRSKGSFPANSFSAGHFNGGGHLNAAGGEVKMSLEESLQLFRQLLPHYLHQLENADK